MQLMTKLETIIMNRTGCNRETANLVANDILTENDRANAQSLQDVMICPHCNSEDCYEYSTDEIDFEYNGVGHYYVDCHCRKCHANFRLYTQFNYFVTNASTKQEETK